VGDGGTSWVEAAANNPREETKALAKMKERYERAEKLARATDDQELFYPALNRMAAELIVDAGERGWRGFDRVALAEARANLVTKTREDPDFWSVAGLAELRLYEAIAERRLVGALAAIICELDDLRLRVSASSLWASVQDQLRFVLSEYGKRATAAERKAVVELTKHLDGFPDDDVDR